ncbi:MAG: hypothetical protein R6W96_09545 [Clostridia bacterium]
MRHYDLKTFCRDEGLNYTCLMAEAGKANFLRTQAGRLTSSLNKVLTGAIFTRRHVGGNMMARR